MFRNLHCINPSSFCTLLRVPTTFIGFRLLLCEPLYPWFLSRCLLILPALSSSVSAINFSSGDPVIRSHVFPRCQNPLHLYSTTSRTVAHFKLYLQEQPRHYYYVTTAILLRSCYSHSWQRSMGTEVALHSSQQRTNSAHFLTHKLLTIRVNIQPLSEP